MPFDTNEPNDVRGLQTKLNRYNELYPPVVRKQPLEINGQWNPATRDAWLDFKKRDWTDPNLSVGYLNDRIVDGKTPDEKKANLQALGIDPDPGKFDRNNPPVKAVEEVQKKLGVEPSGKLDEATKAAILKDKRNNWTDDRVTDNAVADLGKTIARMEAMKQVMPSANISPDGAAVNPGTPLHRDGRQR